MKLSINILTWNTWPTLHETIHVLADELKGIESEIIIVDNGSTDGCQDVATIKNHVNLGISKGKNQGIDASHGEFIMMIDGDVVPVPNSIRCLLEYMETHPDIEALGFHANKWAREKGQHEIFCHKIVDVEENKAHCCYYGMYRRSVFDKGARFDESYGVGYGWEDLDFYNEMAKRDIKQYHCHINHPAGKYFHAINSSIQQPERAVKEGIKYGMGFEKYMETSKRREQIYKSKWVMAHAG